MKIWIVVDDIEDSAGKPVQAEIVDIAPHLAGVSTWVVHRCAFYPDRAWVVSDAESGQTHHPWRASTRAGAVQNARNYLRSKTVKDMQRIYRRIGKRHA